MQEESTSPDAMIAPLAPLASLFTPISLISIAASVFISLFSVFLSSTSLSTQSLTPGPGASGLRLSLRGQGGSHLGTRVEDAP